YDDLAKRLGPQALLMPMATSGIELAFGGVIDPQFGALAIAGVGGILIELLNDRRVVLAPVDAVEAERQLKRLQGERLFDGYRGSQPVDRAAIAAAFSRFSVMLHDLAD